MGDTPPPRPPKKQPRTGDYHHPGTTTADITAVALAPGLQQPQQPMSSQAQWSSAADEQSPMMNQVVLKRMFELSCPEELSPFRRVCKLWHNIVTPVWLQNGPTIVIKDQRDNDKFLQFLEQVHLEQPPTRNHDDMIAGIQKYRKFLLEPYNRIYRAQHFEVFWTKCGDDLTHLTLQNINIPDVVTFQNLLFCKHTPNLESLVVEAHTVEGPVEPRLLQYSSYPEHAKLTTLKIDVANLQSTHFPLDWKCLLSTFPNLTHFGIGRNLSTLALVDSQTNQILWAIREIRDADKAKLDLKSFIWFFNQCNVVHYREGNKTLAIPAEMHQAQFANLQAFKFCFTNEEDEAEVQRLLSIYAKSLRKLELYRSDYFEGCPFPQTRMTTLATLEISGYAFKDLTFLKKLPNLRSLRLWADVRNATPETIISATISAADGTAPGILFPSVSEFSCNYVVYWEPEDFVGLLKVMPNLNHLGMCASDTEFRMICRYLPQLEHLTLFLFGDYVEEFSDRGPIGTFAPPNIMSLQKLKSFSVEGVKGFDRNYFSNYFITRGLANLRRLEKLYISVIDAVDAATKQWFVERIPFAKVIFTSDCCPRCRQKINYAQV